MNKILLKRLGQLQIATKNELSNRWAQYNDGLITMEEFLDFADSLNKRFLKLHDKAFEQYKIKGE